MYVLQTNQTKTNIFNYIECLISFRGWFAVKVGGPFQFLLLMDQSTNWKEKSNLAQSEAWNQLRPYSRMKNPCYAWSARCCLRSVRIGKPERSILTWRLNDGGPQFTERKLLYPELFI